LRKSGEPHPLVSHYTYFPYKGRLFFLISFIHMYIQCLGHFSPEGDYLKEKINDNQTKKKPSKMAVPIFIHNNDIQAPPPSFKVLFFQLPLPCFLLWWLFLLFLGRFLISSFLFSNFTLYWFLFFFSLAVLRVELRSSGILEK
jgi:hypothetical protein